MKRFCVSLVGLLMLGGSLLADEAADIRARTAERRPVIAALVQTGAVVEASSGYLEVKDEAAVGDKSVVVAAENKDRKVAYEAIAKSTGSTPEAVGKRRAERIRSEAGK